VFYYYEYKVISNGNTYLSCYFAIISGTFYTIYLSDEGIPKLKLNYISSSSSSSNYISFYSCYSTLVSEFS